eukprot:328734-Karenia_brevis.AAC.1
MGTHQMPGETLMPNRLYISSLPKDLPLSLNLLFPDQAELIRNSITERGILKSAQGHTNDK